MSRRLQAALLIIAIIPLGGPSFAATYTCRITGEQSSVCCCKVKTDDCAVKKPAKVKSCCHPNDDAEIRITAPTGCCDIDLSNSEISPALHRISTSSDWSRVLDAGHSHAQGSLDAYLHTFSFCVLCTNGLWESSKSPPRLYPPVYLINRVFRI